MNQLTGQEQYLYNLIPTGKANAISRRDLVAITGISERGIRRILEHIAYSKGVLPVCNLFHGYFKPETAEELKAFARINHAYLRKFAQKKRVIERAIDEMEKIQNARRE